MFLNRLRLNWTMSLLSDAVSLLRARALWNRPVHKDLLYELSPRQLALDLTED